jgi:serine/threonine protein kinase
MSSVASNSLPRLGQYEVIRTLTPGQSYLATDAGGRTVVLKILADDCLLRGKLNPGIHDRLAKVRQLPHIGLANLVGVDREGKKVFVIWQFVEGKTWDQTIPEIKSSEELSRLAREVVLAVESLHMMGIVHGRIHGGNVIVDQSGGVHLTHISPLLYDEPEIDVRNLGLMIESAAKSRGWTDTPLARIGTVEFLPQLQKKISVDSELEPSESIVRKDRLRTKWGYVIGAVGLAIAAIAMAVGFLIWAR